MPETRRLKLIVSYDGRDFAGWQSQRNGKGVQDRIESAFARIAGKRVPVVGAGRTDAGVHAIGQCAHADVRAEKFSPDRWQKALNANLPPTIRVLASRFVNDNFHARFSATGKLYRYRIVNRAILSPFEVGRAWHIMAPLDRALLRQAANLFGGYHDFRAFAANRGKQPKDSMRTIRFARVSSRGDLVDLEFCADGFLYKMVRLMVGAMVRCALRKELLDRVHASLRDPSLEIRRFVAPPDGLYLVRVQY